MKTMTRWAGIACAGALILTNATTFAQDAAPTEPAETHQFQIELNESTIEFTGSKVSDDAHSGGFSAFEGTFTMAEGDPTSLTIDMTIDANSLWSDAERLTGHLKNPDFFNVEQFPTIHFKSTNVYPYSEGQVLVVGDMTMLGVTSSLSLPVTINAEEEGELEVSSEFKLPRFLWGMAYIGRPNDPIVNDVDVRVSLELEEAGGDDDHGHEGHDDHAGHNHD